MTITKQELNRTFYKLRGLCETFLNAESASYIKTGERLDLYTAAGSVYEAFSYLEELFENNDWNINEIFKNAVNTEIDLTKNKPIIKGDFAIPPAAFVRHSYEIEQSLILNAFAALQELDRQASNGNMSSSQYEKWEEKNFGNSSNFDL